jgi:hypothetical protein
MTLSEILEEVYDDLGYQTNPANAVVVRITRRVNRALEAVLSEPGLESLLNGTETFASVADQARYGLANVSEIRGITTATNDRRLIRRSESWYRATNPDPASHTGTPGYVVPIGPVAVAQVPSVTGLWAVSSSASDTARVTIDAVRSFGYPDSPTATVLTGTTRVAIGSLTDYIDVTQFQLSAACVGDVSLYDAVTAGNLLAVIPRGQTTSRYLGFYLSPTPSAAETFTAHVEHELQPLVSATDEPLLPAKFHRILGMRVRMREYEGKDDGRFKIAAAEYQETLQRLKAHVNGGGDPLIPGGAVSRRSDLGSEYPASTIWD